LGQRADTKDRLEERKGKNYSGGKGHELPVLERKGKSRPSLIMKKKRKGMDYVSTARGGRAARENQGMLKKRSRKDY